MRKKVMFLLTILILLALTSNLYASDWIYHRDARMFGKLIHYDSEKTTAVMYGSIFLREGKQWRRIYSKRYFKIIPASQNAKEIFTDTKNIGKTIVVTGKLHVWPGQRNEILEARTVETVNYHIPYPTWYGFGITLTSERIYKTDISKVTDFVDKIHEISEITKTTGLNEDNIQKVRSKLQEHWNLKWVIAKDIKAENDQIKGSGGWQIYEGLHGDNCFIEKSPVTRKNIDKFMDAVRTGGGIPEESGEAVICGYVNIIRNRWGDIVEVYVSGTLHETPQDLIRALEDHNKQNRQTWRLEGWTEETAEEMKGKLCWVSGTRVLVYDDYGNLTDQYFVLRNYITRSEFNKTLDTIRNIVKGM